MSSKSLFSHLNKDIPASVVVFFVALPLCLGIALASGAPLFSGVIAGIIGGVLVGTLSGSTIGVSGPAAGLAAIVLSAISQLGGYENLLVAVVLAGVIQILFGIAKLGIIGYYFPSSVIKGMLTGIGIIIIIKQIPHFFGYDASPEGVLSFNNPSGSNTIDELMSLHHNIIKGSALIGIISLIILVVWDKVLVQKAKLFQVIQGPLVVVLLGILFYGLTRHHSSLSIGETHLVSVPVTAGLRDFLGVFTFPNFSIIFTPAVWVVAFTLALVASLETLLSVEATDKLDPDKNVTPTNRELFAQGAGNIVSGLIGGLPITQVIVRSSANIQSGGKTKLSTIIHGFLLLISVITIPRLLNMIPLSVLAAILLIVGYKLAKPALFYQMWKYGWKQFLPFIVTVLAIIFTDLLMGIGLGLTVGIIIVLLKSYQNSHFLNQQSDPEKPNHFKMILAEEATFLNKGAILKELDSIPQDSYLEIDVRRTRYLDHDIIEIFDDFAFKARNRNIHIKLISERGIVDNPDNYLEFFTLRPKIAIYQN